MRRWGIILAVVALVLIAGLVFAALNLNRFLNQNRDAIAKQVQAAIGREVRFGKVGITLAGGLGVRVEDLHVGDDPAFSEQDFLAAEAVDVGVKILPALLGRIELRRVVLRSPSISVIQTSRGLSTESLGGGSQGAARAAGEPAAAKGSGAAPALLVSLVDVRNGTLHFVDRTAKPPVEVRVAQLDVTASEVSLDKPVRFRVSAALLGAEKPNLSASGTLGPLRSDSPRADLELRIDPLKVDEALRLRELAKALPPALSATGPVELDVEADGTLPELRFAAKLDARGAAVQYGESFDKAPGVPLELSLRGEKKGEDVSLEELSLRIGETELHGRAKLTNLKDPAVDFALSSPAIQLASFGAGDPNAVSRDALRDVELKGNLSLPRAGPKAKATLRSREGALRGAAYDDLHLDLRLADRRLDIAKLSLGAFGGALSADGFYDMANAERPRFDLRTQIAEMRLEKILESQAPSAARFISGGLAAKLDLRGAGAAWEQIKRTLSGGGDVRIADGVIRDFNPAGPTLRAVTELPVISSGSLRRFLDAHPQVFGVGDTPFEKMEGKIEIRDGWVYARDFALAARDYSLAGSGRYSLDNRLDFKTLLTLSQPLSDELLAAEKSLRYLRTPEGRVAFPMDVRGTPPKLSVFPDVNAIAQGASREALTGVIEKALGGKKTQQSAADEGAKPSSQPPPPKSLEDLGRDALQRGLGELLGGPSQKPSPPAPESEQP